MEGSDALAWSEKRRHTTSCRLVRTQPRVSTLGIGCESICELKARARLSETLRLARDPSGRNRHAPTSLG